MLLVDCSRGIVALYLFLGLTHAGSITTPATAIPSVVAETCEYGTINYITDVLPKQCLKSTWTSSSVTTSTRHGEGQESGTVGGITSTVETTGSITAGMTAQDVTITEIVVETNASDITSASNTNTTATATAQPDSEQEELEDTSFLSFEEWRKKNEAKAEQEHGGSAGRKLKERRRDLEGIQNHLDSLGDEGEIDLDFGAFKTDKKETKDQTQSQTGDGRSETSKESGDTHAEKDHSRGKDAGKTCKERANYASFDAGATVLKTHKGAKNSKAILIEHKDSYMLSECKINNKFVIIELNEEVWIDTVVLANYEFFSSMIRTFRVSISERYPVKMDKWKIIGTYEARNTREIQAFFIENPQVWGRYLRIEFLTHYGNEYYCPLSLIRVHGARMLDNLKEGDANNEEDDDAEHTEEATVEDQPIPENVAQTIVEDERLQAELEETKAAIDNLVKEAREITAALTKESINVNGLGEVNASLDHALQDQLTTPWVQGFDFGAWMDVSRGIDVCLPKEAPQATEVHVTSAASTETKVEATHSVTTPSSVPTTTDGPISVNSTLPATVSSVVISSTTRSSALTQTNPSTTVSIPPASSVKSLSSSSASIISSAAKLQNATSSIKSRMSTTSTAVSATPTQQESFFKAVSRRLQLLEANSTLSLQYIEEQSRALREAFSRVEKRQVNKTATFLETLNSTVFTELKEIRQQYDEIWQSTVISLESQRAESRKEILAITSRLNILADEIVFQKRMSIVQSVLLLLCLGLVIFSRVSPGLQTPFSNRSRYMNTYSIGSPIISLPGSPEYDGQVDGTPERVNGWPNGPVRVQSSPYSEENEDVIYEEEEDAESFEEEDEGVKTPRSPPTPTSLSSRSSSFDGTPPRVDTSTPVIFEKMPQLQRAASSSYSFHLNHEKDLLSGSSFRHSIGNGTHESISKSRQRAKSDVNHDSHPEYTSILQTPPKNNGLVRHFFHRTNSKEKPLPDIESSPSSMASEDPQSVTDDRIDGLYDPTDRSPSVSSQTSSNPRRNFSLPANGQTLTPSSHPASPRAVSRSTSAAAGVRISHERQGSSGSFGIARKPLPALPSEGDGKDGSGLEI